MGELVEVLTNRRMYVARIIVYKSQDGEVKDVDFLGLKPKGINYFGRLGENVWILKRNV